MAFGKEWNREKKLAFENGWDEEKMFELYIYKHMKIKNLHGVAEIFAKEANLETLQLVEIKENLLAEWWQVFWILFCARLSNKDGVDAPSSGQMAFGKEWDKEKKLALKNEGNAEKMLELYIYDHMKKKNLHGVAEIFAKEANIETSQLVEIDDENLLTEFWEMFWPTFCSKNAENAESSGQAMLASSENQGAVSTQQTPTLDLQLNVLPEFSTLGGNTSEDNRSQMPLTGGEESDGVNPVSPRTHVPAFYFLLMMLYIVRSER